VFRKREAQGLGKLTWVMVVAAVVQLWAFVKDDDASDGDEICLVILR
jgi:hypothetical protein